MNELKNNKIIDIDTVLSPDSLKETFNEWLYKKEYNNFPIDDIIKCIDRVSIVAINNKFCSKSLWYIMYHEQFKIIYDKINDLEYFRNRYINVHKTFQIAGDLYLQFLNDNNPIEITKPLIDKIEEVLSVRFTNGYRLNSPIEMIRLKSAYKELNNEEISCNDDELKNHIASCGTLFENKIYIVLNETTEKVKKLSDEYFNTGAQIIFFKEFYNKNEKWLFEEHIISEDMLVNLFNKLYTNLIFTQNYFGYIDASIPVVIEKEVLRVWGDDILLTYEQLSERLQYIPIERIKFLLGQNSDFIWSKTGSFTHINRIGVDNEERDAIRHFVETECNAHSYVSIINIPLNEFKDRNYELSETAVYTAVYQIYLADKFVRRGKILTRKGDIFNAADIMKEYCKSLDRCKLEDLFEFEKELTGENHHRISMEIGFEILVRIDKNNFVSDKFVDFDISIIDKLIESMIDSDYVPIKSFTAFGAFPYCGYPWNLFLLESYLRKYSNKYSYKTLSNNSQSIGIMVNKNCKLDYTDILIDVIAASDISINENSAIKFLYENGYTGNSKNSKINEIVRKAKSKRESRG